MKFIKRKEFIIHDDLQIEEVTTYTIEGMTNIREKHQIDNVQIGYDGN